jgi:hypothetical protein
MGDPSPRDWGVFLGAICAGLWAIAFFGLVAIYAWAVIHHFTS